MEFITRNQHLIMTWYNKQIQKENMLDEIPDVTGFEDFMKSYVPRIFRVMLQKHNFENIIKIHINPLLVRNLCHYNCEKMIQILNKKEKKYICVAGYNIFSCPCGKLVSMEVHSVLKHILTGEYLDLTTDFGGDKTKFFLPIKDEPDKFYIHRLIKNGLEFFNSSEKEHKCDGMTWIPPTESRGIRLMNGDFEALKNKIQNI